MIDVSLIQDIFNTGTVNSEKMSSLGDAEDSEVESTESVDTDTIVDAREADTEDKDEDADAKNKDADAAATGKDKMSGVPRLFKIATAPRAARPDIPESRVSDVINLITEERTALLAMALFDSRTVAPAPLYSFSIANLERDVFANYEHSPLMVPITVQPEKMLQ
jgi:hypothetical protein